MATDAALPYAASLGRGAGGASEAFACIASAIGHALLAVAFAAVWITPWQLEQEKRRREPMVLPPPDPITWVTTEPGTDVPVADQGTDKEDDAPPGAAPGDDLAATPVEPPTPVEAPTPDPPDVSPKLHMKGPVSEAPESEYRAGTAQIVERLAAKDVSTDLVKNEPRRIAVRGAGLPGATGVGGAAMGGPGEARAKAPDLAARLTKELPRYAADVSAWKTTAAGTSKALAFTLELDDDGKVVRPTEPSPAPPGEKEAALALSFDRTMRALVMKLALPDLPVQAGLLKVTVRAIVIDGPAREVGDDLELSFAYDGPARKGVGTFVLRSGRTVAFHVEVTSVEPKDPVVSPQASSSPTDVDEAAPSSPSAPSDAPPAPSSSAATGPSAPVPSSSAPSAQPPPETPPP